MLRDSFSRSSSFLTVFNGITAGFILWTMIRPGVLQSPSILLGLYYLGYAFGGPGFSIPMGLLMAGVSIPAAFMKLLPRWIIILGLVLAVAGELSWFYFVSPKVLFLIPLTRFPGFVWIIAVGFALPKVRSSSVIRPGEAPARSVEASAAAAAI